MKKVLYFRVEVEAPAECDPMQTLSDAALWAECRLSHDDIESRVTAFNCAQDLILDQADGVVPADNPPTTLATDPYTERSLELDAMSRDDLRAVLDAGDYPSHVYDWQSADIRAVILEAEFPGSSDPAPAKSPMDHAIEALQLRWGDEHDWYDREAWREDVSQGNTKLGYWEWVQHSIEGNGGDEAHCAECGKPSDDGEGWDGLCGDCADQESLQDDSPVNSVRKVADEAFEAHDFGEDYIVASHNGWEWDGESIMTKVVFLETKAAPEAPTLKAIFRVEVTAGEATSIVVSGI